MNKLIFREYDVRTIADKELTDEVVDTLGRAFGSYLVNSGRHQVVVGKDNRLSSARIAHAVIQGILSTGCDVLDIGDTITPALCFAMAYLQVPGGIIVTGSHYPPEYNGIKFHVGDRPLYGEELNTLAHIIESNHFAQGTGRLTKKNIIPDYLKRIKERIYLDKTIRVVVDCGNGNTAMLAPMLFQDLGCDVTSLYCELDGHYPHHDPNPTIHTNLNDLMIEVKRTNADLGIAYDGDGNRIGVVDNTGHIIMPDILLGLLAKDISSRKGPVKVVCDAFASQALIEDVEQHGGKVVMCRAGYPYVLETMFSEHAALAGELVGHICYNEDLFAYADAIFTSCHLLQLLSRTSQSLSLLLLNFPTYISTPELRIPCSDDRKFKVIEEISNYVANRYRSIRIDGVRIFFGYQSWALIRASTTQPMLSIRLEAKTEKDLDYVKSLVASLLRRAKVINDSML